MAMQGDPNLTPATSAHYMINVLTFLMAHGFTCPRWGDGTTYFTAGVPTAAVGAGGLQNSGAWFEVVSPDGKHAMTFQRGSNFSLWRVKVAPGAFTAGTPDGNETPQHADQDVRVGSGTDAAPGFGSWFSTDGTYKQHIVCDDAAPYGWMSWACTIGTGANTSVVGIDPVISEVDDADDTRKWVSVVSPGWGDYLASSNLGNYTTNLCKAWLGKAPVATPTFVQVSGFWLTSATNAIHPIGGATNAFNAQDDLMWVEYWRPIGVSAPNGRKGRSTMIRWSSIARGNMVSAGDDPTEINAVHLSDVVLHYPNVTPTT